MLIGQFGRTNPSRWSFQRSEKDQHIWTFQHCGPPVKNLLDLKRLTAPGHFLSQWFYPSRLNSSNFNTIGQ